MLHIGMGIGQVLWQDSWVADVTYEITIAHQENAPQDHLLQESCLVVRVRLDVRAGHSLLAFRHDDLQLKLINGERYPIQLLMHSNPSGALEAFLLTNELSPYLQSASTQRDAARSLQNSA